MQEKTPQLLSIQVGQPKTRDDDSDGDAHARAWTTAFFKQAVRGRVRVGVLNPW